MWSLRSVWQTGYRTKQYGHAATRSVAAGRQGTVLQVLKGRSRLFPDISGFFRFENVLFKSFRKNVKNRQT